MRRKKAGRRAAWSALALALISMMAASAFAGEPADGTVDEITLGMQVIESGNMNVSFAGVELESSQTVVEDIPDQEYAGKPVEVVPVIKYRPFPGYVVLLEKDIDFTVTYQNNDRPGTATVIITGIESSHCIGTITKTFTITGEAQETPQVPAVTTGLPVGSAVQAGSGASKGRYQVTGEDTVTFVKSLAAKKAKTLTVPATVVIAEKTYKVTAVGAGAFASYAKATKLTVGSNVVKIGSKAFRGCKKLKILTVKSKRLTVSGCKKCLSGSYVTTVRVPSAKKKAYKKIFKKSVCGRNVKIK